MKLTEHKRKPMVKSNVQEYIYIDFHERTTVTNKVARVFYLLLYALYCSVWYYFIPFTSIILSYQLPKYYEDTKQNAFSEIDTLRTDLTVLEDRFNDTVAQMVLDRQEIEVFKQEVVINQQETDLVRRRLELETREREADIRQERREREANTRQIELQMREQEIKRREEEM